MRQQREDQERQQPGSFSADASRLLLSSIVATRTAPDLAHLWRTAHAPSTWAAAHLVAALLQLSELAAYRQPQGAATDSVLPEVGGRYDEHAAIAILPTCLDRTVRSHFRRRCL